MTNEEIITQLKDIKCHCQEMYEAEIKNGDTSSSIWGKDVEALAMAIKSLRYKPIILQEHDAEPRRLRAILDTETQAIYVCELTRQSAENLGMTIEEDDNDK